MAEGAEKQSKTEDPTSKRYTESRKKGQVAKSMEVTTAIILLTVLIFFDLFGMDFIKNILIFWSGMFSSVAQNEVTTESLQRLLMISAIHMFYILAPPLFTIAFVGVLANVWQNNGWLFSWDPLKPKFNKLNPLSGFKRFLGMEGVTNLIKSVGKLALVSSVVYLSMFDEWEKVPQFMMLPIWQTVELIGDEAFWLVAKVLMVLIVIAVADFVYQRYQYKQNLKMTKQEVKDERKQSDGNPAIKQRIRQRQFDMFKERMMTAVPEAEVVITNPTHLSIALRYDKSGDPAPVCVAKGAGFVALKIREIAKENDIPIIENKPLAQTLFKTMNIGEYIPETLYKTVAEVLAYVYRLKMKAM